MASGNSLLMLFSVFVIFLGGEKLRIPPPRPDDVFTFYLKIEVPASSRGQDAVKATLSRLVARLDAAEIRHWRTVAIGKRRIALFLPALDHGGERRLIRLLNTLDARLELRLVHRDSDALIAEARKKFRRDHPDGGEKAERDFLERNAPAGYRLMTARHPQDDRLYSYYVSEIVELDGGYVLSAYAGGDRWGRPQIEMRFNADGAEKLKRLTGANIGRRLAVVFDGRLYCAPRILAEIGGESIAMTGNFSEDEAKFIAAVLTGGVFPFGIAPDTTEALLHNVQDFYTLGWCYEHGAGVPADLPVALEHYRRAAAQGFAPARAALKRLEKR